MGTHPSIPFFEHLVGLGRSISIMTEPNKFFSITEVVLECSEAVVPITPQSLRGLIKLGRLQAIKHFNRHLIPKAEVDLLLSGAQEIAKSHHARIAI